MRNYSEKDRTDKLVSLCVALQVTLLGCKNVLVQGVPFLYDVNDKLNVIILGLITPLYIYSFFIIKARAISREAKFFWKFILLTIIVNPLLFPMNIPLISSIALRGIVVLLMTCYLLSKLNTLVHIQHYMLLGTYVMTASCILFVFLMNSIGHTTGSDWSTYSMPMSNVAMWAIMWQLHAYFKQGNKWALFAALICFAVLFSYGARNCLLAIAAYLLIFFFYKVRRGRTNTSQVLFLCSVAFFVVCAVFWHTILVATAAFLDNMGISGRAIYTLLDSDDIDDLTTGRSAIHDRLIQLIWEHPLLGMGICGDEANMGELAHSLYLNIFSTWGIIFGSVFFLALIRWTILGLKSAKGLGHELLVLLMCMVYPRGFSGGDIWVSDVFWWMMGIIFMILSNSIRTKRYAKYSYNG